jgi:hypothetical protein
MTSKPASMATLEGESPIGGRTEESRIEREMIMAEAGETNRLTGDVLRGIKRVTLTAAREPWEPNQNGNRPERDSSESSNAPGD